MFEKGKDFFIIFVFGMVLIGGATWFIDFVIIRGLGVNINLIGSMIGFVGAVIGGSITLLGVNKTIKVTKEKEEYIQERRNAKELQNLLAFAEEKLEELKIISNDGDSTELEKIYMQFRDSQFRWDLYFINTELANYYNDIIKNIYREISNDENPDIITNIFRLELEAFTEKVEDVMKNRIFKIV